MAIQVTIGQTGMGKTWFAVHMANSNAASGGKVVFCTSDLVEKQLYKHFDLSSEVKVIENDSLKAAEIEMILKTERCNTLIVDSIFPLLEGSTSLKSRSEDYEHLYKKLEELSEKYKVDIYLFRQIPFRKDKALYSSDIKTFEQKANALYGMTGCQLRDKTLLEVGVINLRTNKKMSTLHNISHLMS